MNNKWYLFFFLLLAVLTGFYLYNKYQNAPNINFEQLKLSTLENEVFEIKSLKGKKIIVCFSASWCGNCIDELKAISKIKSNELADVEVLIISDEPMETIKNFKLSNNISFTYLKLNQSFQSVGIEAIPTSYILNKRFEISKQTVGYVDWTDASTIKHLKTLMD